MDPRSPAFAITYANDRLNDGAGAQLHRIYGLYAVSRYLHVPYVHSPLKTIGYHGLRALEDNAGFHDTESRYNRLCTVPSDVEVPHDPLVHDVTHADEIEYVREASAANGRFNLCRVLFPFSIADKHPEIYRCIAQLSPFRRPRLPWLRVAIHVRRGELYLFESQRMLPNAYYISCAQTVAGLLRARSIPFVCELYTEVPTKTFVVTPAHHGVEHRIPHDVVLGPEMNAVEEFDAIPNLRPRINIDPIEALEGLATADVLIMSRSSFSYVAAILNPRGAILCHPFWHSPLPEWILSDGDGRFSEAALLQQLAAWQ
ncbi:MAG TPA: hypothetical protein VMS64_32985 [Candidatus Methylomirabilis sp.]|nr:hypothetical protein [Candidatus Methylomirabilis sp.]